MSRRGFNRLELGILLAILSVIVLALVPAVFKVRRAAARAQCHGNLCQLALTLHNHASVYGTLPAGAAPHPTLPPAERLSWYVAVLPFMEHEPLAKRFDPAAGWDAPANREPAATPLSWFRCPSAKADGAITHRVGCAGVGPDAADLPADDKRAGAFGHDRRRSLRDGFPDGTSNTLLAVCDGRDPGPWARGGPATLRGVDPTAGPPGVLHRHEKDWFRGRFDTNAALADGSYRTFRPDTAPAVWAALATAAGGESLPPD